VVLAYVLQGKNTENCIDARARKWTRGQVAGPSDLIALAIYLEADIKTALD
jgi:hypothetical protein